jgi:predicted XRE-type DNA-binding protein
LAPRIRTSSRNRTWASNLIERCGLTQAAAASLLGVTQPRVSDLVRGKIDRFSMDTLVDMLARAGVDVRVTVRRKRDAA